MEQIIGWHNLPDGTLCYGCSKHNTTTYLHYVGRANTDDLLTSCNCPKPELPQANLDRFRAAQRDYKKQLDVPGSNPSENK